MPMNRIFDPRGRDLLPPFFEVQLAASRRAFVNLVYASGAFGLEMVQVRVQDSLYFGAKLADLIGSSFNLRLCSFGGSEEAQGCILS